MLASVILVQHCSHLLTWQNIVLSQKPAITTTMTSLPPALLEQLLAELSTLASVYHKPPESFVGKGRFGADEIQRAAIQEQRQDAADNPIAASVAAATAAANGGTAPPQNNMENLLDIDFDGAAPASAEQNPTGLSTPERGSSPATALGGIGGGAPPTAVPAGGIADMMGLFDAPGAGQNGFGAPSTTAAPPGANAFGGVNDIMGGFGGLDLSSGSSAAAPSRATGGQKPSGGNEDLFGLL